LGGQNSTPKYNENIPNMTKIHSLKTMEYKNFITQSLEEASEIAKNSFGKVTATTKEGNNNHVLTETDMAIGKLLINKVLTQFPEHNIIDEEAGVIDKKSDYTWVIDPIDGTSNFAHNTPLYGIMLGLLKNGIPIAGGFSMPHFQEIYVAEKGHGAYCNSQKLTISNEIDITKTIIAYGIDGHPQNPQLTKDECMLLAELILNIRNLRMSNSLFDFAMVAKGNYSAFLNRSSKIWDNVAPQIIIEEAGGMYTDFFGIQIDYSNAISQSQDNFTFCAAAPAIHSQLLKIIQSQSI
jgi:myo-inositol-1(or 4)-monophosphatase